MRYGLRKALIAKFGNAFLLRMAPLNFGMTTVVCALSEITFTRFIVATFLGMNVEMPLYVFAGTTLRTVADTTTGGLDGTQTALVCVQCAVIVILLVVITFGVRRVLKKYNLQHASTADAAADIEMSGELADVQPPLAPVVSISIGGNARDVVVAHSSSVIDDDTTRTVVRIGTAVDGDTASWQQSKKKSVTLLTIDTPSTPDRRQSMKRSNTVITITTLDDDDIAAGIADLVTRKIFSSSSTGIQMPDVDNVLDKSTEKTRLIDTI
jgi:hypothetical protein